MLRLNGRVPRDVIEWRLWSDEAEVELAIDRSGIELDIDVIKAAGEPLGAEVSSAVFDRVRTCDNHCEFCFIYQLPKGLRRSLYLKDDDYRLSFLYGNFTTLTRFTEADLERVVTERLSPLNVSIHATDPELRSQMLRNPRGATSLRWLRALLDHGIEVRGQIVVCPGRQRRAGPRRHARRRARPVPGAGVGRRRAARDLPVQPRGRRCATHTPAEAAAVVDAVEDWQDVYAAVLGRRHGVRRRRVLPDGRPAVPGRRALRGLRDARGRHRHGPHLRAEFTGAADDATGPQRGFFAAVDGPPTTGEACGSTLPPNPAAYTGLRVGDRRRARRPPPAPGGADRASCPVSSAPGCWGR